MDISGCRDSFIGRGDICGSPRLVEGNPSLASPRYSSRMWNYVSNWELSPEKNPAQRHVMTLTHVNTNTDPSKAKDKSWRCL